MPLIRSTFIISVIVCIIFVFDSFGSDHDDGSVLAQYFIREQRRDHARHNLRQHLLEPGDITAFD